MMYNGGYRPPINPYAQRLNAMEQQMMYQQNQMPMQPQSQPMQSLDQLQPQISCFSVNSIEDMGKINPMPNIIYLGMNPNTKEIYTRKINNDGLLESETYSLVSGKKEKGELQAIVDKLDEIENKLNNLPIQRPTLTLKGNENAGERDSRNFNK